MGQCTSMRVIYDGFRQALGHEVPVASVGLPD
jgi:hypothetical protein